MTIQSDVVIEAGTDVLLDEGAGVIFLGQLQAKGEPSKPIRFLPATSDQLPWGAIVLQGNGANNSLLQFCEFSGGAD